MLDEIRRLTKQKELALAAMQRQMLPSDSDMERRLLLAMLDNREASLAIGSRLQPEDFYHELHRRLFSLLLLRQVDMTEAERQTANEQVKTVLARLRVRPEDRKEVMTPEVIVTTCVHLRELRRQRLILDLSESLYLGGLNPQWCKRAGEAIVAIQSLPMVEPIRKRDKEKEANHGRA